MPLLAVVHCTACISLPFQLGHSYEDPCIINLCTLHLISYLVFSLSNVVLEDNASSEVASTEVPAKTGHFDNPIYGDEAPSHNTDSYYFKSDLTASKAGTDGTTGSGIEQEFDNIYANDLPNNEPTNSAAEITQSAQFDPQSSVGTSQAGSELPRAPPRTGEPGTGVAMYAVLEGTSADYDEPNLRDDKLGDLFSKPLALGATGNG